MKNGTKVLLKLGEVIVGEFGWDSNAAERSFRYDDEWQKKGFPLSPSLPFGKALKESAFLAFLENMLPEGRALEHLCRLNNISKNNILALSLAIKNDLSGAAVLLFDGTETQTDSTFRPISDAEILQRLDFPETHPMDIWDGKPRLSVAGMQTKLNVLKLNGKYGLADGQNLSSTHILKFEQSTQKHLLLNEFLTMSLARCLGTPVAELSLNRIGTHRILAVTRFDRKLTDSKEGQSRVFRRHVIDACQALGLPSSMKYEQNFGNGRDVAHIRDGVSFEKLFSLSRYASNPSVFIKNILYWLFFNLIVGNCDAHGKNISFFVSKNGLMVAPWYDLVSVAQIDGLEHAMAMSVGDEFDREHIHALQILYEAQKCGLSFELCSDCLEEVINSLIIGISELKGPIDSSPQEQAFVGKYILFVQQQLSKWKRELKMLPELRQDENLF